MNILSFKQNNSRSFEGPNKKNKLVTMIFAVFIALALFIGLFGYVLILDLKENISLLKGTNQELTDIIRGLKDYDFLLNSSIGELKVKTDILERQQQSLLQEDYDFLLFLRDNMIIVKSGLTSKEVLSTTKFSEALGYALDLGNVVLMSYGNYSLDSDVVFESKSNVILDGQGSVLNLNGYSISFRSDVYSSNSNNQVRNLVVREGTFRLVDSFRATFQNMVFEDCISAIEVSNINTWSEATKFENIYWNNCRSCLTFKTPMGDATGSYESTALDRCYFNLYRDNSVAVMVEEKADVSNGQWTNVRVWMHAKKPQSQTGLYLDGSMSDTILTDVIFESFGDYTNFGIFLGKDSITGPLLGEGTSFHGTFENPIGNDAGKWIHSVASIFKEEQNLASNTVVTIQRDPLTICSFDANITVEDLGVNEEVMVLIELNFIDQTSNNITLSFSENQNYMLTAENLFNLYPSQNVIQNIEATNLSNTKAKVTIRIWGTLR